MPETVTNWPDVKATAIATGSLKVAAEQHGVEYGAVKVRAHREKWPTGRRVHQQAKAAQEAANTQIIRASNGRVTSVTSAADALREVMSDDDRETKLSLSRSFRRMAKDAEAAPLAQAADVLTVTKGAALVHGWASSGSPSLRLTMFGPSGPVVDVESSYSPE